MYLPRFCFFSVLVLVSSVLFSISSAYADAQWVEVRSPHFSVITDAGEKRGRDVALRFEQMRTAFGVIFQRVNVNIPVPLQIIAFRNGKELKQYAPLYEGKPVSVAGFFQQGEDRNFIAVDLSAENNWGTVFHEYAHLLINGNLPPTAVWFDEGFAEYCSSLRMDKKEIDLGLIPPDLPLVLSESRWLKLVDLFNVGHESKIYNRDDRRSTFYAQSWLTVHYMMSKRLMKQVAEYNTLVQEKQMPVPDAIRKAFGMEPEKLEKDIANYYSGGRATYFKAAAPPGSDQIEFTSSSIDDLQLKSILADFDYHSREYRERGIAGFGEIVAKQPDNEAANRGLGYAALQQGDLDKAAEHFKRAAASDIKDPRIHYFLAMMMTRKSMGPIGDEEIREAVIKELKTAISLDPNYADAYNLLGLTYSYADDEKMAVEFLSKAIALSPRNEMYMANLASVYFREQKLDEAVTILKRLKESSNPQVAAMAQQNLENIENYNSVVTRQAETRKKLAEASERAPEPRKVEAADSDVIPFKPDPTPVRFMKGKLLSVDCAAAPSAILTVSSGGKTWKMTTRDSKKLVVIGADEFSCSWKNVNVAVNYRPTNDGQGQLVSVELQ
jgi:tetratricopeptide (TPR) repeat protein